MVNIAFITTITKGVAAAWAFLCFILAAAMIGQFNSAGWRGRAGVSGFNEGNAVLAAHIFNMLYFGAATAFLFLRPTSILISVLVDVCVMGFLFIFTIAATGALTEGASFFRSDFCTASWCGLATAVLALSWLLVFIILGLLILEIVVTLRGYGGSMDVWKTPFNELVTNGSPSPRSGRASAGGVEHRAEMSQGPSVVQQNQPAVVQTA